MKKNNSFIVCLFLIAVNNSYSQGWVGNGGNNLNAVNSSLSSTPINVGIGTNAPTAQFHTTGTVRHENILQSDVLDRILVTDVSGYLYWRDASTIGGSKNSWLLDGNSLTNPNINFLGTTDNNRLVFRTNNTENMTILTNGNVGIGISNPGSPLHVFSPIPDNQLFLSGFAPSTRYFQGTDWLASPYHARIGLATANTHFVTTSSPGDFIVQAMDNSNLLFGAGVVSGSNGLERMRITSIGYIGISTIAPTAKLHVNCSLVFGQSNPSNIRFENLQTGTGNALVIDANGFVYRSNTLTGRPTNDEITGLKDEIQYLKKEIEDLKSIVNSMKGRTMKIGENKNEAILYQNTPNPFKNATIVRYYIPEGSQNSLLIVSDLLGNHLKNYSLNDGGSQSITINGGELSAGTYLYTLLVNGREVDSKKMILTR